MSDVSMSEPSSGSESNASDNTNRVVLAVKTHDEDIQPALFRGCYRLQFFHAYFLRLLTTHGIAGGWHLTERRSRNVPGGQRSRPARSCCLQNTRQEGLQEEEVLEGKKTKEIAHELAKKTLEEARFVSWHLPGDGYGPEAIQTLAVHFKSNTIGKDFTIIKNGKKVVICLPEQEALRATKVVFGDMLRKLPDRIADIQRWVQYKASQNAHNALINNSPSNLAPLLELTDLAAEAFCLKRRDQCHEACAHPPICKCRTSSSRSTNGSRTDN
ncbi:uncharacterized protein B0I36DRAFT_345222 [Microdochium trichocladiopsis]|uniref:Uncharacterized protein n=1 Tax=Microdochium trichocladiopsis TaxID=1682393 RepID=A0A9P8YFJ3_9PEZI|nr:uncharacterized protein B0I36DRAFT_345222 [Microdochium trichocladiopsis]KAH7037050.1 hypothetical protein B0I36DRAFT_345222 [Microdochium trichocladiopsis]